MGKYREVSEENYAIFKKVLNSTSLPQWIEFEIFAYDKLREIYKIEKLNDIVESLTKINIVVVINEDIFDKLSDSYKTMLFDECLAGISVNESDTIQKKKPDISTFSSILSKYGDGNVITLKESIISLFSEKQRLENDEKQAKKEEREKKKFSKKK
jgi:hypothetical protein